MYIYKWKYTCIIYIILKELSLFCSQCSVETDAWMNYILFPCQIARWQTHGINWHTNNITIIHWSFSHNSCGVLCSANSSDPMFLCSLSPPAWRLVYGPVGWGVCEHVVWWGHGAQRQLWRYGCLGGGCEEPEQPPQHGHEEQPQQPLS